MANQDERYAPDPFALSSPAALFRQNTSRKRPHYSPAWLSNYSNTATKPTLRVQVCMRMRSEADPSTGIVFVTRWIGCSPLLGFVRSLISVHHHFGYLWDVAANRRASSLAIGRLSTARRTIHEGCPHAVSEISKICVNAANGRAWGGGGEGGWLNAKSNRLNWYVYWVTITSVMVSTTAGFVYQTRSDIILFTNVC